jgi:hypothetical protein
MSHDHQRSWWHMHTAGDLMNRDSLENLVQHSAIAPYTTVAPRAYDKKMKRNGAPINSMKILTGSLVLCACCLCRVDSVVPEARNRTTSMDLLWASIDLSTSMRVRNSSAAASSTGLRETHIFLLINMVYVLDLAAGSDQMRVSSCGLYMARPRVRPKAYSKVVHDC